MPSVGNRILTSSDFERFLFSLEPVELDSTALDAVNAGYEFIKEYARDKVIYGINTGFGPMAQVKIDESDKVQLQLNLIRSHSTGAGVPMSELHARATMLARLNTLMIGYSGVHPNSVLLLCKMLNEQVTACIYEKGGVGASGDLVQLAHLALNMIGEGQVFYKGTLSETSKVFEEHNITPLTVHMREGLAVMNGTSAMTGIGMVNIIRARKLVDASIMFSAVVNELMESFDDHFSQELNEAKIHKGQREVASRVRQLLVGSKLIRKRDEFSFKLDSESKQFAEKVQEYYSLRCVPQILGPILEAVQHAQQVVEDEVNSVNDNPIVDAKNKAVFHGGNFHGDYVALAMDQLKMAITKMTMLSERQLNFLLNNKLNDKLPPFLNAGKLGLNFGLQGMQFTATSATAENQTLSFPMYVHSIPNNNDNQDIVSMGCNAALLTSKVLDNALDVLSIQAIAIVQAAKILNCPDKMAPATKLFYEHFNQFLPHGITDQPAYDLMRKIRMQIEKYF